MRHITFILVISMLSPMLSRAQKWKQRRVEYSLGIGTTNFLGELGGADGTGSNGLKDIDLSATRYTLSLGYRYQMAKALYIKGNLNYARVYGNDELTENPSRSIRQLNFRSNIVELSGQFEYMFLRSKKGIYYRVNRLRGVRGRKSLNIEMYLFGGIGGIWFDPQGQDNNGNWKRLKPLRTEGQGLPGGPSEYSGFSVVLPYGLGIRKSLGGGRSGELSISLELSMRKTFTDYIDDVSSRYYDNDEIRKNFGDDAAFFADPSGLFTKPELDENGNERGQQRGNLSNQDTYMMGIISLNYKLSRRRRNLPKF